MLRWATTPRHLVFCILLAILLGVAACAPAAAPAPVPAPAAPKQPAAPAPAQPPAPVVREEQRSTAAPTPTPAAKGARYGGRLVVPTDRQGPNLDTLGTQSAGQGQALSVIYSKLVRVERGPKGHTDIVTVPDLAERWEVSSDGKQYTFYLRKDAKFQNIPPVNGRAVTAEDVKYTFERILADPASPFKAKYIVMKSVDVLDKNTVRFILDKPWALWIDTVAAEPAFIVPKEIETMAGGFKGNTIGSGPMILERREEGVGEFYKKNPNYYNKEHIYLDNFTYQLIEDPTTRVAAFRAGQIEILARNQFNKTQLDQALKSNPDTQSSREPSASMSGIWIKFGNPLFKDLRVRQAISKAINRQGMIDVIFKGDADFTGVAPPIFGDWALSQEEIRKHYSQVFDLKEAKRLLAEAGFPNGVDFTMEIQSGGGGAPTLQQMEFIKKDLESVGIRFKLLPIEYGTWLGNCYQGQFKDATACGQGMFSVWDYLYGAFATDSWRNGGNISIPELDKMHLDALATPDPEQRRQRALNIQRYILDKVLYKVHTVGAPSYWVWHPWVKNVRPVFRPYDLMMIVTDIWFEK